MRWEAPDEPLAYKASDLDRKCEPEDHKLIEAASGGPSLEDLTRRIIEGLDPDVQAEKARQVAGLAADQEPTEAQVGYARAALLKEAARPLAENPAFRTLLQELKKKYEQVIDEVSRDELLEAGIARSLRSPPGRRARALRREGP